MTRVERFFLSTTVGLGGLCDALAAWARPMKWLRELAFPTYDCEDCIGMRDHGCYCSMLDAPAPGMPVEWWREIVRWLYARLYPRRWMLIE
jgi:hypothetical protein